MADLEAPWQTLARLRRTRDDARGAHRQALFEVRRLDLEIAELERRSDGESRERLAALVKERAERRAVVTERQRVLGEAGARVGAELARAFDAPPQRLIGGLDDATPFLLLPLRLETRFGERNGVAVLRVRFFLDDIAVAQHERALTDGEVAAGKSYWTERIRAQGEPDAREREARVKGAWNLLATRHGAYRAGYVARVTRPANFGPELSDPAAATYGAIPTKPFAWSETPRSFVMPDRFVVRLEAGGTSREVEGGLIPDDLPLGPDPLQAEAMFGRDESTGKLAIDPALRWLVDFDEAEEVGMALTIPLEPGERSGFSRIVVLGLRLSSSAADATAALARMVEAHRFSGGVSLVPQGTPTNNTDEARSGLATASQSVDLTLALELAEPAAPEPDHFRKSDGERLADALGLPLELARRMPAWDASDVAEALAMNRALWSGTLGDFAHELLEPLVAAPTVEKVRRFFGTYVTGRGLLPALRVGNQPYGVLTTSALALFAFSEEETGGDAAFFGGLLARLRELRSGWNALVPRVAFVGDGGDSFSTLLDVLGQQASSVEYYSRKAVSTDYLANYTRFRGTSQAFATELWEAAAAAIAPNLAAAGLDPSVPSRLRSLVFWREHDLLNGPLVDDDPRVPFAEDRGVRPFDGVRNYLDWFRTATSDEIRQQIFRDGSGKALPPPEALLYRLLRASFLAELGRAARGFVVRSAPAIFAELPAEPVIANVGATKTFSTADVLGVDVAKLETGGPAMSVADHLVLSAREPGAAPLPEAAGLSDMGAALATLAPLSTAKLERLLAEHVDLASYRLDAWIQALFARRLLQSRERERAAQRSPAIHLGCYGWVENVAPATRARRTVPEEELAPELRASGASTVVADPANGGFVHAPSLSHAATAAVLRNGYLSHVEPERADLMAVNLSSGRVRAAMRYLDGMRSGQELAALLGYQLERGLHEHHPGVELDEFVYVLRERFPFTSGKLTDVPVGTAAEAMEARNVINGYDLLEHVRGRSYPYGIVGLPSDGASATHAARAQTAAIRAEIDALAAAMDALADVMLAESVHQAVQGNYDRVGGVLRAITEGTPPPEPQVVETPRSGRSLTFRLALPLDPAATTGWNTELTPRARANAALNHFLASVLPAPADVEWRVTQDEEPAVFVALDSLGLEPIDCVLMAGEKLGDLSSELERLLVHDYRASHDVPDSLPTLIDLGQPLLVGPALVIDPRTAAPGKFALASLWPLFKALAALITKSRPLFARDFELPSEAQEIEPGNPKGLDDGTPPLKDLEDLKLRLENGHAALEQAKTELEGLLATSIGPLYAALQADPAHAVAAEWSVELPKLRAALLAVCRFGFAEALPVAALEPALASIEALVAQAKSVLALVTRRLAAARSELDVSFGEPLPSDPSEAERARAFRTERRLQAYTQAGRELFGSGFVALPLVRVHAESAPELASALAAPAAADPLVLEEWLDGLSRVRAPARALATVAAYRDLTSDALATPATVAALQLPARAGTPWIGGAFGANLPPGEFASVVLAAPFPAPAAPLCGLLLDEWTEVVPATRETTGIAFHFNRPNATAPQALLLAVAPRLTGAWRWSDLVAIVEETLERAKLRAVEPDDLLDSAYFQTLPGVVSEFSRFDFRSTLFTQAAVAAVARE
jgi:hypothetical protein